MPRERTLNKQGKIQIKIPLEHQHILDRTLDWGMKTTIYRNITAEICALLDNPDTCANFIGLIITKKIRYVDLSPTLHTKTLDEEVEEIEKKVLELSGKNIPANMLTGTTIGDRLHLLSELRSAAVEGEEADFGLEVEG